MDEKCLSIFLQGELTMDFIERLFGIAPDGGSGTLEMALFLIPLAGLLLVWYLRQRKPR
jgi:hypothetical protein